MSKFLNEEGAKKLIDLAKKELNKKIEKIKTADGTALVFNETDKSITLPELTGGTQGDVPIKGIKTIDGDELVPSTPDKIVTLPQLGDKNLIEKIKTSDGKDLPINEKSVTLPKTENFEIVNELPSTPNEKIQYIVIDNDNPNIATSYIYNDSKWVKTSSVDKNSLLDVYTKTEVNNLLHSKDEEIMTETAKKVAAEAVVARANEKKISDSLKEHVENELVHITQLEREKWNQKIANIDFSKYDEHIENNNIHVTLEDKQRWDGRKIAFFSDSVMTLPTTGNVVGNLGYVRTSAPEVSPMTCETYMWDGNSWKQIVQTDEVTIGVEWEKIVHKPNSSTANIDKAVEKMHSHENMASLEKIGQTNDGEMTWNNKVFGTKLEFYNNNLELPNKGKTGIIYIVYEDERVRGYSSLSIYQNGAYHILGRGEHNVPPLVDKDIILQAEYHNVEANSTFQVTINKNPYYAYQTPQVLSMVGVEKIESIVLTDFSKEKMFEFDDRLSSIKKGYNLDIKHFDLTLDSRSSDGNYIQSVGINIKNIKNITYIG